MKSPSVCQLLHVLASEFVGWFVSWFVGGCVGSVVGCFVGCFVGCMVVVVLAGSVVEAATEPLSPTIDMTGDDDDKHEKILISASKVS